jgi:hypothetical protein
LHRDTVPANVAAALQKSLSKLPADTVRVRSRVLDGARQRLVQRATGRATMALPAAGEAGTSARSGSAAWWCRSLRPRSVQPSSRR